LAVLESAKEALAPSAFCHAARVRRAIDRDTNLGASAIYLHAYLANALSRIFLATVCLIIYGSLYPWHFHARELTSNPAWILVHAWPSNFDAAQIKDIAINILLYTPLGLFGFLSLSRTRRKAVAAAIPVAIGFALSFSIEILQLFDAGRDGSALDVLTNTTGSGVGVLCGLLFENSLRRIQTRFSPVRYHQPGALLLLVFLAAYQLSPFFPDYSVFSLRHKLVALFAINEFSVRSCLGSLVEWLAIARVVELAIDPVWAGSAYLALWMLVPAKILIAGRTAGCAELAGASLAYFIWHIGFRQSPQRGQILAALFTGLIIVRGLAPYQFTDAAMPFSWIPFAALFETERVAAMTIFLGKLFAYGTFVWLLRDRGWRMRYAATVAAAILGAIEAAQMYLPGRVPEITDPLIALFLGWVFWLMDDWPEASGGKLVRKTGPVMAG
jgi:VanZ family protein